MIDLEVNMLEKLLLINFSTSVLNPLQVGFWVQLIMEEADDFSLTFPHLPEGTGATLDPYRDYIALNNGTNNYIFKVINLLQTKRDEILLGVSTNANIDLETGNAMLNALEVFMIEIMKFCTRFYRFSASDECQAFRNISLSNPLFHRDRNMQQLFLSEAVNQSLTEDEVASLWEIADDYFGDSLVERGSYCTDMEEEILEKYDNESSRVVEVISIFYSSCDLCLNVCISTQWVKTRHVDKIETDPVREAVYSVGIVVSVVFLSLTLLVFVLLKELRRSVHGVCTSFHLISMTAAYTCLALVQLRLPENLLCVVIGNFFTTWVGLGA